ncbi:undecaprenyl/decaprenyl-phosphate alpha-N-acetylglucosaminyl 1-phosphate transferase [Propioniciclava coleopterorum]|uniref:Undecaprenyl/decaprenyl-phosphate alpha-N-acetylglucosaminyl 1-phosphate transferase n=1 Tax=Propioniciclava coleopterorum TaxID=2714937 RepID=A0A6G7Y9K9_9ACTN|nr:MraY family glycosyltransferase [Propioniciclava coleopterorum]QIK73321.1 undecaprenyl/decaprenyl-phosphate alpha-N-acetylglucosaminyl 1-phosphate transferase [Propioniciclava coleopterorum]
MREYLLVLFVAAGVTYVAASLARRYAFRFNAVALVRDRDVHTKPVPYFGGVAMLAGLIAALILATNLPWLGRFELVQRDAWAIFLGALVICVVGVIDDLFELGAAAKFSGEVLAAGIVVLNGVKFYWIPLPDRIIALDNIAAIALAVFVILFCTNAVNFMDGLDGLAAGVVAIGAASYFLYAYLLSYEQDLVRATTSSLVTVALVGICLGFLPHNIHRARMFMGDSGALLLGFLLATSVISLTGQLDPSRLNAGGGALFSAYLPLLLPFAVLALPVIDLVSAYVRRTLAGKLWFEADKQHLHHRMLQLGHSHRRAVGLLWLWAAVIAFGAVGIGIVDGWWPIAATVAGLALAAVLTFWPRIRGGTHG